MRKLYLEERIAYARELANTTYAGESTPVPRKDFNELMEKIIDALDGFLGTPPKDFPKEITQIQTKKISKDHVWEEINLNPYDELRDYICSVCKVEKSCWFKENLPTGPCE